MKRNRIVISCAAAAAVVALGVVFAVFVAPKLFPKDVPTTSPAETLPTETVVEGTSADAPETSPDAVVTTDAGTDYSQMLGSFRGFNANGDAYTFHGLFVDGNEITASISRMAPDGSRRVYDAEIAMDGTDGILKWTLPGVISGEGAVGLEGDRITLTMSSPDGNADFTESEPVALEELKDVRFDFYEPGEYICVAYGENLSLYKAPDSDDAESADLHERYFRLNIEDIRKNPGAFEALDIWRGKTSYGGVSGWIKMGLLIPTQLEEVPLNAAEMDELGRLLEGYWLESDEDYAIIFSTEPNGSIVAKSGPRDAGIDLYGTAVSAMGTLGGLVKVEFAAPTGTDMDGDPLPYKDFSLYIDMTQAESGRISWSTDNKNWMQPYFTPEAR